MKIFANKLRFCCIILLVTFSCVSFAHSIKGSVLDVQGNPVSFATIFVKELNKGITTGERGTFTIPVESGSYTLKFQCVGFQPEIKSVQIHDGDVELKVVLKETNYTLEEVVISGRENPANRIMRATITRSQFFFKMLESYSADVYVKVNFRIDKLSAVVKYMTKDEKDIPQIGKLQFAETHNLVTYKAPDQYTQKVLKFAKSGSVSFGEDGVPGVEFLTVSVYQPKYGQIPSPLGQNAFSYYDFYLSGISVMGDYSIYKIKVTPKRPGIFFRGFIYINSKNYFVDNLEWKLETSFQKYTLKMNFDIFQEVIALPSSYYLDIDFEMMGNKLSGNSSSSLRYTNLKVNEKARIYQKENESISRNEPDKKAIVQEKKKQKLENEMNNLMNDKEMSLKDMNKFMRTLKKIDKLNEQDTIKSLEVKDPVVVIKDSSFAKHDTLYWRQVRPIDLSSEEKIAEKEIDSVHQAKLADTLKVKPAKDTLNKTDFMDVVGLAFLGGDLVGDSLNQLHVSGLLSNNTYFTPVDGFTLGTKISYVRKHEKFNKLTGISYTPSYAFSRKELMSEVSISRTFDRSKQFMVFFGFAYKSRDFNPNYPVDLFLNTLSSLFLYDNKVRQIHEESYELGGRREISNGLVSFVSISYDRRKLLGNTSNYSFSKADTAYSPNETGNVYLTTHPLTDHEQFAFNLALKYTYRNKYRMKSGRKINLGSDFPTLTLGYLQGIKGLWNSASDFRRLSFSLEHQIDLGLLSEIWYQASAGSSFKAESLQLPDFYHPNVTALAFDFRDTRNSYVLMPSYQYSSPGWYVDAHFRYKTSCLLVKRLPWIGEKLFTEAVTLSYYHTEKYPNYVEAGYGFCNLFFAGSLQAVVSFSEWSYNSWGIRAFFSIK